MFYVRSVNKGHFLGDPSKPIEHDVPELVDPELSVYRFASLEELILNAVALRMQASGHFEYIVLDDADFVAIGSAPTKTPGATGVAEVDDRHFVVDVDHPKARLLVPRVWARMVRHRIKKETLREYARHIQPRLGWPDLQCWLLK